MRPFQRAGDATLQHHGQVIDGALAARQRVGRRSGQRYVAFDRNAHDPRFIEDGAIDLRRQAVVGLHEIEVLALRQPHDFARGRGRLDAEPERLLRYSWRERPQPGDAARQDPLDSTVTFTLARTISGGTHLRIVHDGFARKAMPAVAMTGAGCRLSLGLRGAGQPIAANTPLPMQRAA